MLCALWLAPVGVQAQEPSSTLKKIADSAVITLGFHESTPPFTFLSADGKPMGYS